MALLKRILYWVFLTLLTAILGGGLAVYFFKEQIINSVIAEVNGYLRTPVQVEEVEIDFFHGFPDVAINFNEVYMQSGFGETLLSAEQVYVLVSPWDMVKGDFNVDQIEIAKGDLNLIVNRKGEVNFRVFNQSESTGIDSSASNFTLRSVKLREVNLSYTNDMARASHKILIKEVRGKLSQNGDIISILVGGDVEVEQIKVRNFEHSHAEPLSLNLVTEYNVKTKILQLEFSEIVTYNTNLRLSGALDFEKGTKVDLHLLAENANVQFLNSFLPSKYSDFLKAYESKGNINLDADLKGVFSDKTMPALSGNFHMEGVEFLHSELNADVKNVHLDGRIIISDIGNLSTGTLSVTDAKGLLMGEPFDFDANVKGFKNPNISASFNGSISMQWLANTLQYEFATSAGGLINVDVQYKGTLNKDSKQNRELITGMLTLNDVAIDLPNGMSLANIGGELTFTEGKIEVNNISGFIGASDVLLNGYLTGLKSLSGLSNQSENVKLKADLKAGNINLDEITQTIISLSKSDTEGANYKLPEIDFTLDFILKQLKFKRFRGKDIVGALEYSGNKLTVNHFGSNTMGGKVVVKGLLDQKPSGDYFIEAYAKTNNINLDSLFYVFNNFNQSFLTDQYLKGQLNAEAFTTMYFDKDWRLRRKLLKAETKLNVVNGELNNFKPLMALSKYLDDREDHLDELRFAQLTNYVNVNNDTVFIPKMKVKTNVRDITVAGTQTLSQYIDYRLSVPVINENIDKDEAFGAVQKVQGGSPNLLFRIKGTTTDYKVNYDLIKAVGGVFRLLNLKETFKQREQVLDSVTLDEEEFDW